ncbi:MAG: Glu-tRNA(Gln) amidotransferase subunit GatE [Candidatus Aenigmatarchaeota archaeon]
MDYKKIGLKSGIEIHRQLDMQHKLFCSCDSRLADKAYMTFKRKLRAVSGELGELDTAALHEFFKNKDFVYSVYPAESCLVEADDEPPHELNKEALELSLRIALMLNCDIPDEIHVMRKTVIDGSNTSGFQRTAIVGMDGWIETSFGKVGITSVAVEEESCQILGKDDKESRYGLDRLGIPLVEIGTDPDIHTPEQAKEVSQKLGMILKSTGKVKSGLGTIRQDVNVSIAGGHRVEIKGVQELNMIPKYVENEILRQQELIKKKQKVSGDVRKPMANGTTQFMRPLPGAARLYPETDIPPIRITKYLLDDLKKIKTELIEDKIEKLEAAGLGHDLATKIGNNKEYYEVFSDLSNFKKIKPAFIAETIVSYKSEIHKKNKSANVDKISGEHLTSVFKELDAGKISKDAVMEILAGVANGKKLDFRKYQMSGDIDLDTEIDKLMKEKPGLSFGAYMGILMGKFKGKASGDQIASALKKKL